MPTSLVTGAAGFIGSHLAAALLQRGDVIGVDNLDSFYSRDRKQQNLAALESPRFRFVEADVRDAAGLKNLFATHRPDLVFHLAALTGVRPSIHDAARYVDVNVRGLASVLDAVRDAGSPPLIFASSSSVYGDRTRTPFAETDPADQPVSPYAATKRAGELLCGAWSRAFDLRIGIARLFTTYGPRQRPDLAISRFLACLAADRPLPLFGDGSSSRDYTYVDDIVAGLLEIGRVVRDAEAPVCRGWNLGSGRPVTLGALIEELGALVGRTPRIESRPPQPGDVGHTAADLSRSRAELGYEPRVSLADGLRRQWEWMQASNVAAPA